MRLGTNPRLMSILDYVFDAESCIYTSLTFKYGTQQPTHRDTPHFATWPPSYFVGVWTALEDVSADAGPLFYYEGAQRFPIDEGEIYARVQQDHPHLSEREQFAIALDLYNGVVITQAPSHGTLRTPCMKRGDVAIWHAQTPHGGLPANNPMASRWSVVFHCAPAQVQVHQHEAFFRNAGRTDPPPPRYGFRTAYGRKVAVAGEVAFM